jgi:hypothetical protein
MRYLLLTFFSFFILSRGIFAIPKSSVVGVPTNFDSINAIVTQSAINIRSTIKKTGVFNLVSIEQSRADLQLNEYLNELVQNDVDVIVLISVYQQGPITFGELKINTTENASFQLNTGVRVKSRINQNIPLLLQRELLSAIKEIPLYVEAKRINNTTVIDAGTYSGLEKGKTYSSSDNYQITMRTTGRFVSEVTENIPEKTYSINFSRNTSKLEDDIKQQITQNILRKHGAGNAYLKGQPADQRYLESLLVVNPLGNILLPGYAAYLSTSYMDLDSGVPSYESMGVAASLYLYQLLYIPVKNDFKVNFFPWIDDSNKSYHDLKTQQYLWATIPLTFTATYLDHLSLQYHHDSVLPPGIDNPAVTVLHSLIIPGGGLFYKGYRLQGWAYFGTEFALGMYAASHWGMDEGTYALYGLGVVKAAEIIHSIIIQPSYDFYTDEVYNTTDFKVSFYTLPDSFGDPVLYAGGSITF